MELKMHIQIDQYSIPNVTEPGYTRSPKEKAIPMMKLRQLVANSLPMGRNRKKKDKEKQQGAAATKATSPSSVYNGNYHVPFPKRHRSPVPAPPPKLPDNHNPGVVKTPPQKSTYTDEELELITEMRNIKMVDHKPTSPLSPMSPSIDKTMDYSLNFNLNSSDSKFSCYKHIHSTFSSKSDRQSYDDRLSTFVPHGKKNTLQRHSFSPEPPTYARHMKTPERQVYTPDHYITSPTFSHHDCISVTSGNRHSAPESHYSHEKPELHYSVSPALDSNSDINSNSLTRPRTRIKTNPWLPSPRGSSTSSNSSPAYSPTDMYSPIAGKTFPQEAIYEEIPGCKESPVHYNIKPSHWVGSHTSDGQSDTDSLQRSQVSESDNSLMSWSADCPPSYERSLRINSMDEENDDEDDKMEELTLSMKDDYKDPDILEMKDSQNDDDIKDTSDTKSITSKVSFHYEEVFESKMEDDCDNLSSNESLSDGYGSDDEDDVFLASGACSLVTSVSDVNSLDSASLSKVSAIVSDYDEDMSDAELDVWQIRQDSSADTDDTICEYEGEYDLQSSMITEPTPPRIRRFPRCSPRPGSSSPSDSPRSSTSKTVEEDSNHPNEPLEPLGCGVVDANDNDVTSDSAPKMLLSKLSDVSSLDSGADSGLYSMDSVSLDRSVGEVRSSLQDKVTKLRQDKLLVDEKIRQAQEEDRIRMQEKMRFQKQVTQHRKQMLLSTLQDLKMKLENQSQRLQTTYSSVLHMQKHMIRQRKHMSAHEISAADAQEAPF